MAHFAKVSNGIVVQVIVAEPEFFDTFTDSTPGEWIQTSYNTRGNVHYGTDGEPDGGVALRGNFAAVGYTYDKDNDVFYAPQRYASWILDKDTWTWRAPIPNPNDGKIYDWDEVTQNWETQDDIQG
jgi:hypothetical protein